MQPHQLSAVLGCWGQAQDVAVPMPCLPTSAQAPRFPVTGIPREHGKSRAEQNQAVTRLGGDASPSARTPPRDPGDGEQ